MTIGTASFASAATVSVLAEGQGGNPGVIDFTITYNPFTDGSQSEPCGSGVPCLEVVEIDLTAGAGESNAAGDNASFVFGGLTPEGASAAANFTFGFSDTSDPNDTDNSLFNLLTVTALNDVFDRGNQLTFSAAITGLGPNNGDNFQDRGALASVFMSNGMSGSGGFATVVDGYSSQADIAPVPLPASALLLLAGLGGLAAVRRRKAA